MKLEGMEGFGGGSKPKKDPEEMERLRQASMRISKSHGLTGSTERTREISAKRMENLEMNLEYKKLATKLEQVNNRISHILKDSKETTGKLDKEARDEIKTLKKEKKEIENQIAETTNSNFWRGDQAAA